MRARSNPGMTLIETLVSLAMLAVLAGAVVSWTTTATRAADRASDESTWHASATRVLDQIHTDLRSGDFDPNMEADAPPRVAVEPDQLTIRTRVPGIGPATRAYLVEDSELRAQASPDGSESPVLLGEIEALSYTVDAGRLTVRITSTSGLSVQRHYRLPAEGTTP